MDKYLKMADVFKGELFIDSDCDDVIVDDLSLTVLESFSGSDAAKFALHAINSHDELVQMNQDLLAALEAVIDDKAPLYHDCIDNGESECGWCIARKAIAKAKGGAA